MLQQILFPYTVTRDMYFQLAVIIAKQYRTSEDRVDAVRQKLQQWKFNGSLRFRASYRRRKRTPASQNNSTSSVFRSNNRHLELKMILRRLQNPVEQRSYDVQYSIIRASLHRPALSPKWDRLKSIASTHCDRSAFDGNQYQLARQAGTLIV
ncbi:hypothetical protein AAMO2058_001620900 [Amorphochlora amoebiformis]